jgi:hypothetical protein
VTRWLPGPGQAARCHSGGTRLQTLESCAQVLPRGERSLLQALLLQHLQHCQPCGKTEAFVVVGQ